jgi:acyl carrier protein
MPAGKGQRGLVGTDQEQRKIADVRVLRQEFPLLGPYLAPRTPTEDTLAGIFCNALGMDKISINDDFEELGGDSLIAMSICADIEKVFAISVPVAFLVRAPTIAQLAPRVDELVSSHKA